jgi:type IV pilus secretin PilQ/predicted competence protein
MKFKRMLTVGLMALFGAGTATAASQLNSVQVTPKANTATVTLRTTGSYAHKEYRPDQHLVLVDLTGVTASPAVERAVALDSAVLKGYKLSSYTSASGGEVTRIELVLGDGVSVAVSDKSDGLQILLSRGAANSSVPRAVVTSVASSFPSASTQTMAAVPKPAQAAVAPSTPVPQPAVPIAKNAAAPQAAPIAKNAAAPQAAPIVAPARPVEHPAQSPAGLGASIGALTPTVIRSISVQRGRGTLDITIEGPSSAQPFLLKNPDRLVLDFSNSVVRPSVRNIAVHTKDVLQVRVGRYQAEPPITRVVVDLSGPRTFEVVPSAKQVIVRVNAEESGLVALPRKAAPVPVLAPAEAPSAPPQPSRVSSGPQPVQDVHPATPSASVKSQAEEAPRPAANSNSQFPDQPVRDPGVRAGVAAETLAISPQVGQAPVEAARLNPPAQGQLPGPAAPVSSLTSKYTGEPISVNLKDVDLKDFFRLIHEISGLNIVLDPTVKGTVTLVLDDVPWDQALDIVLKNNALDRELQGNVLRIAATDTLRREAVDRRAQSEAVALAVDRQTITRFLSYAKAKEIVPTVKKFLTARGDVISDERTNALIISDIPSVLPNLDRLISQLDRKSQEVEIEVRVVSATRSFTRDLGFQLGFNWGNGVSTIGGSSPNASTTASGTGTPTAASNIPLFTNLPATGATTGFSISNITKTYGIDAILTAAENHNLAKVLSRPRVVTQSNVKAEVKQGVKLPVATPSTGNSIATVSYIDAVLRLSVTPQITSDNTIFLTVDVENTQPSGQSNGNFIMTTQQATTQVLVTDGGTVVIGGVIQTTNTVSTSQTPVLGNIPWLGNLFKERSVKTETDELIFFITPKIIQT